MRVPSVGLTLDERRIVNEGMRLAEYMMRNYQDPPNTFERARNWFANLLLVRN